MMSQSTDNRGLDCGPVPAVINVPWKARQNQNFRAALWTGKCLQMTLMCIPVRGDIGAEMHPNTDQIIRVESGQATVRIGACEHRLDSCTSLVVGDTVFVPCGTWHNVVNTGDCPLQLSSVYAPPQHPRGTIHRTKAESAAKH